jgi:tetratricopeptide (TPR) repeat protein
LPESNSSPLEIRIENMKDIKAAAAKKMPKTLLGRPIVDTQRKHALEAYGAAMKLMQEGKFDRARAAFEKLLPNAPMDLAERSRLYKSACERQMQAKGTKFASSEEQYDYAISLLNTGFYEEARDQFQRILKTNPTADYAYYGLAILESMTGLAEPCLEHLAKAIELSPRNRIQARSDSDFQDMADDPRFTELLYPEVP